MCISHAFYAADFVDTARLPPAYSRTDSACHTNTTEPYFTHSVTFKPSYDSYACMPCPPQILYGRYAPFSLSMPAKKMKAPRKTQKNNSLKNTKYKMSTKRGPVFTFSLPGGRLAPCPLVNYAIGFTLSVTQKSPMF